jgi:uncharacterized protein (DUF2236 family)
VRRLTREDEVRYYREMSIVARLFGTPASVIPRSLTAFRDYLTSELVGPTVSVTEPALRVAAVVFEADLPAPMRVLVPAHRLVTAGLLPPRLRQEVGLRWTPLHEQLCRSQLDRYGPSQRRCSSQPHRWHRLRSCKPRRSVPFDDRAAPTRRWS